MALNAVIVIMLAKLPIAIIVIIIVITVTPRQPGQQEWLHWEHLVLHQQA